jgi:hypothetical protein
MKISTAVYWLLIVGSVALQWWWAVPIIGFIGMMHTSIDGAIESKKNTGYPELEHTDAIGLLFGGLFLFIVFFVLFIASFWIPPFDWF